MRRLLLVLSSIVLGGLTGLTACGFDDVTYADPATSEGGSGGVDGAGGPGTEGGDGSPLREDAGELLIDGSSPDALIVQDAGGTAIDAASCAPAECDCDKDGFKNTLKAGCAGGDLDCDDSDPRSRPGQGYLEAPADTGQRGDWNCVDGAEPLYTTGVSCAGLTLGLGCANIFGFEDQPGCGQTGSWIRCARASLISLDCSVGTREPRKQACK